MQLWLHLSLDFDPNSFSLLMHLHHLAYRGQQFPGIILISRPLPHPCAIYISAETRASRATLVIGCLFRLLVKSCLSKAAFQKMQDQMNFCSRNHCRMLVLQGHCPLVCFKENPHRLLAECF